jgi:TonB family protein
MKTMKIISFIALAISYLHSNAQITNSHKGDSIIYTTVETFPTFPGGRDSLNAYIKLNAIYPEIYRRYDYKERLFVNFVIEKDGSVSNARLIQGGFKEFEKTVLTLVENMPRWNPGLQNGEPQRVYFTLSVEFCPEGCAGW